MKNFMQSSLEYIEQNLKTDITADELAEMANYSVGHFCRLFAQTMNITVASYILKRRLDHVLDEISSGRKAISVVPEYGFDTYAGFYKAFVKMYGCSPKKYLSIYTKSEVFIMLNEKDIQAILWNWDIPAGLKITDVSMKNWKTGEVEWQMWKIGNDYYLKTNERSIIVRNIKIAKALEKEGLASEFLPIPTTAGKDYVDGAQIFLLTKKVGELLVTKPLRDEEIAALDYHDKRFESPYKLGQAIAKIHRALKTVQDDIKPYEGSKYQSSLNSTPKVKEYLQKHGITISDTFFDDYTQTFGVLHEKMPKQLIHGNPTGNTVVYENGNMVGIRGYEIYNLSLERLFDLIWCAGEINTRSFEEYLPMLKEILRGYNSLNLLTEEEKQAVYYMLCASAMDCIAYVDDDTLDVLKRNMNALVFLAENKRLFVNLI